MKELLISLLIMVVMALTAHADKWDLSFNEELQLPAHDTLHYGLYDRGDNKVAETKAIYNLTEEGLWITDSINQSEMLIDSQTLMPIKGIKGFQSKQGAIEIVTTFSGDSIHAHLSADAGEEDRSLAIPEETTLHNDQLLFTIPTIDFEQIKHELKLFTPSSVTTIGLALIIDKPEKIEVPAGKFKAYPVRLDFGMATQKAWYEFDEPHRLLMYDNGKIQYRLEEE